MLGDLPLPILMRIIELVDYKSILRLKSVSKCLNGIISNDQKLWQWKLEHDFGRIEHGDVDLAREYDLEWKIRFGNYKVSNLEGHSSAIHGMQCFGSVLVTGSKDAVVRVWNLENNECMHLSETQGRLSSMAVEGEKVVIGTDMGYIHVWNFVSGEPVHTWKAHDGSIFNVELQGSCLISGGDGKAKFWDISTTECLNEIAVDGIIARLYVDHGEIICVSTSGVVFVFDLSGALLYNFKGAHGVHNIHFTSRHIFITSPRGVIETWNRKTRKQVEGISGGRKLVPIFSSEWLKIWDVGCSSCIRTFEWEDVQAFSYIDGKMFVGCPDGLIQVYDFDI